MKDYDPITLGILWDRLISIANEIVLTLVRTSFSTIVRESYDLACVLFDAEGRALAQGTYGMPTFSGTAPQTMRCMLERFPSETLRPGDVVITNDTWMGAGHLWDVNIMRPAFRDGKLVGFAFSITHLPDIGGRGYSAINGNIFEEGLQIPVMKLFREGEINEDLMEILRKNVRVNEMVVGDLMANVTATEVGCRKLVEFMDEYRIDDLQPLSDKIIGQSEAAMRHEISLIPDGIYTNELKLEGLEDEPISIACAITIKGERFMVDFAGTGPTVEASMNVPLCYTRAMACYSAKSLLLPKMPNNEGSVTPIEVSAPPGCVLNALPPSATGARHLVGHNVMPLMFGALANALPERVQAEPAFTNIMNFYGARRDGAEFSTLYFSAGGLGALSGMDGNSTTPSPSNMRGIPTEVWETTTNIWIEKRSLRADSGGAGECRGGLGQITVLRNETGHPLTLLGVGRRDQFPARGLHGGKEGKTRAFFINGQKVNPRRRYILKPGDSLELHDAGGGGYGDPAKRAHKLIQQDIDAGFVTVEGALQDYRLKVDSQGRIV